MNKEKKKALFAEFKEHGVTATRELLRSGMYTDETRQLAEAWLVRQQIPWLGLTVAVVGVLVGIAGWLYPCE